MTNQETFTIALVGGGSGGPVTPLLAVAEEIATHYEAARFIFIGSTTGPERLLAEQAHIPFRAVSAGKLRRYFSFANIITPFLVVAGFFQSLRILNKEKPVAVLGAGSFVQVPVLWAARALGIPVVIHQQDVLASLANTLCAPIAKKITVTFEHSLTDFGEGLGLYKERLEPKTVYTGNPVRTSVLHGNPKEARSFFKLDSDLPVILAMGGGTGSQFLNDLIIDALPELSKIAQVIHVTGAGKKQDVPPTPGYHQFDFMTRMDLAYAAADIVISRAGLATITELSNIGKPAIIIPLPDSHQEENVGPLWHAHAAIIEDQYLTPEKLVFTIRNLLINGEQQRSLVENIKKIMRHDSAARVAKVLLSVARQQK